MLFPRRPLESCLTGEFAAQYENLELLTDQVPSLV